MKLSILVFTQNYCGDHSADACIALDAKDGETIEQLISRAKLGKNEYAGKSEHIQIRISYEEA